MAYKFYHRLSQLDYQRYQDFFPRLEADPAGRPLRREAGVECPAPGLGLEARPSVDRRTNISLPSTTADVNVNCSYRADNRSDNIHPYMGEHHQRWERDVNCGVFTYALASHAQSSTTWPTMTPSLQYPISSTCTSTSSIECLFEDHHSWTPPSMKTSRSALPASRTSLSTSSSPAPPLALLSYTRSTRRKSSRPKRSPQRNDPTFNGVIFSVEPGFSDSEQEPGTKLLIKSHFRIRRLGRPFSGRQSRWQRLSRRKLNLCSESTNATTTDSDNDAKVHISDSDLLATASTSRRMMTSRRVCLPRPSLPRASSTSSAENRDSKDTTRSNHKAAGKTCASCKATHTPLWRDAEDGTPLCNACGIRYKKYRIRCSDCWLIPRKDSKTFPRCGRCGVLLRVILPHRFPAI